jgi:acyl-coenzyme A thioesterase PaaI-like protein
VAEPDHGDLCFGCGKSNPYGLQLELERLDGGVTGRFVVKQEHQGADGAAHPGVLTAALEEAMSLTAGEVPQRRDITLRASAPVGTFVRVTGWVEVDGSICAAASTERGELLAEAASVDHEAPPPSA